MPPASGLAFLSPGRWAALAAGDEQCLVVKLVGGDHTRLRIGVKFHLLAVLDAFAFSWAVIGLEFSDLRITRIKSLLDYLLRRHPVRFRLIGPYEVWRNH